MWASLAVQCQVASGLSGECAGEFALHELCYRVNDAARHAARVPERALALLLLLERCAVQLYVAEGGRWRRVERSCVR